MSVPAKSQDANIVSLDQYRKGNYNVLVPTTYMQQISPFHRMRVEEVKISPNPGDGDVFKVGSTKVGDGWQDVLSLSKTAILKLSNAAGIIWNFYETKVLSATQDYVLYQAVGAIRKTSGEWVPLKATKEIDLTVIKEELMEANLKKANEMSKKPDERKKLADMTPQQWAENQTRTNLIQWRKNKLMRAETGAMLRVVRALLAIKHQYSTQELQRPFIVPRVDFSPDYTDPEVRRMVTEHGIKATTELFGAAASGGNHSLPPEQMVGQAMNSEAFSAQPIDADDHTDGGSEYSEDIESGYEDNPDGNTEDPYKDLPDGENTIVANCTACNADITKKVADYSIDKFGRALCYKCQRKGS
ncbi:MAG: hypothetical protein A4E56_00173 [Pelotomaculum sp. PtaU1.Bin065]|nr:MAG: hypothetical protein A4E56_00173 [Pelotomaculum sp. PtaU1.Bin065]